jgi:hypothetical protein
MSYSKFKTAILRGYGVAEAAPIYQTDCSDCMHFSLILFVSVAHLEILSTFLYLRGYQSSARMSFQLMTKATDI